MPTRYWPWQAMNQSGPARPARQPLKATAKTPLSATPTTSPPRRAALSPLAVRLAINRRSGQAPAPKALEVQDGAASCSASCSNRSAAKWWSIFAGAGGKTLLLGALMRNTGRLYAFDVRQAAGQPQAAAGRSGLSNVHPARIEHERDQKIKRLAGARRPRAGRCAVFRLGTLRRNPDLEMAAG